MSNKEQQAHNNFLWRFLLSKHLGQKYFFQYSDRGIFFVFETLGWVSSPVFVQPVFWCHVLQIPIRQIMIDTTHRKILFASDALQNLYTPLNIINQTPIKVKRCFFNFFLFFPYLFLTLQRWHCTCFMIAIKEVPKIILKLWYLWQSSWSLKLSCFLFNRE